MLSLLAVAGVALMGFSPMRPAWRINAWSLQYAHHTLIPAAEQLVPTPSRATWNPGGQKCATPGGQSFAPHWRIQDAV